MVSVNPVQPHAIIKFEKDPPRKEGITRGTSVSEPARYSSPEKSSGGYW